MVLRDLGNPIKPVIDGICPHAISDRLELRQILLDLPRVDRNIRTERRLVAPEGSVGDAMDLLAWRQRRGRHLDRRAQPRPACDNHRRSNGTFYLGEDTGPKRGAEASGKATGGGGQGAPEEGR